MSYAYSPLNQQGTATQPAAMASGPSRVIYLRKVYALLLSGLLAYFGSIAIPILGMAAGSELMTSFCSFWIGLHPILCFLLLLGGSWAAHAMSMQKVFNLIAFYSFAVLFGFLSIGLVGYALSVGGLTILLQAMGLTTFVFGGLTMYVFITKKDFSFMGGFLSMGMFLLIGGTVVWLAGDLMGFNMSLLGLGLTLVSTIIFSLYVLYDTSQILNRYATDMVVPAALALLVDFIILFRNILYLLARNR